MVAPRSTMDLGDVLEQFPLPPSSNMSLDETALPSRLPGASSRELLAIIELLDGAESDAAVAVPRTSADWVDSAPPSPVEPDTRIAPTASAEGGPEYALKQLDQSEVDLTDYVVIGRRDLPPVERWTLVDKVRVPVQYVVVGGSENVAQVEEHPRKGRKVGKRLRLRLSRKQGRM
ncbi:unnamed protein product [Peniophora sp. CBMAI 1063]|nr:unnamed protein product [Peniophora sp. CBMAI 1063]